MSKPYMLAGRSSLTYLSIYNSFNLLIMCLYGLTQEKADARSICINYLIFFNYE